MSWLAGGIIEVIRAIGEPARTDRALSLTSGVLSTLSGALILLWPGPTLSVLAVLLGIWLVVLGLIAVADVVLAGRRAEAFT